MVRHKVTWKQCAVVSKDWLFVGMVRVSCTKTHVRNFNTLIFLVYEGIAFYLRV